MIIETPLQYKATDLQTERCQVDEVVTLGHWQFEYLKNCTSDDFDFIAELRDKLPVTNDNTRHCILVLDKTTFDSEIISISVDYNSRKKGIGKYMIYEVNDRGEIFDGRKRVLPHGLLKSSVGNR